MGIIFSNAALLIKAKLNNVCFNKILTIGHLTLFLSQTQLKQLSIFYGLKIDTSAFSYKEYADNFFEKFLDAKSVMSLDYSDYEDSDIIHDMSKPVDPNYHEKFDVVIDGGSLEHIFNFPVAIANCMHLVKKGGSLFIFSMCNNHSGHGFYQFSPEVFFRIFEPINGFAIHDVILETHPFPSAELSPRTKCYSVVDPAFVKTRVGLVSKFPTLIMIHAIRTEIKPLFADYPIQSDYADLYGASVADATNRPIDYSDFLKKLAEKMLNYLPLQCKNYILGKHELFKFSFLNRRFYKRWYPL